MTVSLSPNRALRFFQLPLVRAVIGFFWLLAIALAGQQALQLLPSDSAWVGLLGPPVAAGLVLLGYLAFVRALERRTPTELAPQPALREVAGGAGLGVLFFGLTIGTLALLGYYRVTGVNPWTVILRPLSLAVFAGVFEELLVRGIIFRIAQEALGTWLALLLSAALFGLLHLANPNATLAAGLAIAIEAGLLLAAVYVATGRLWVSIGLHAAWNFVQGGIFGVAVSGGQVRGLLQSTLSGPALLSGGEFGAEASVVAVVLSLVATFVYLTRARQLGRIVPMPWRRRGGA